MISNDGISKMEYYINIVVIHCFCYVLKRD